ncbi:MAG: PorP/SprF family type IX secretion system membrane protein [Bacteroidota bacterium]
MHYRIVAVILLFAISLTDSHAQDFHYSQFGNAPLHLNPGLTGVFNGNVRLQGNFRNQWSSVPVDYLTFRAAVDKKFQACRADKSNFWAAGLALNYDRAGDGNLSWFDLNLNGSYTQYLSNGFFVTLGGQIAGVQRRFDEDELRFGDQFNGNNPLNPTSEQFGRTSNFFLDFSLGLNFRWQAYDRASRYDYKDKRSKVDVGVALFHIAEPEQTFIEDDDVPLYRRLSVYGLGVVQLSNPLDIVLGVTGQFQGPYREYVGMGGVRLHLNRKPGKQISLQGNLGIRFNDFTDAWFPQVQLQYNDLQVGLSYDINVSDFDVATNGRGGPEVSLRYIFKRVCPVPSRRFCPII